MGFGSGFGKSFTAATRFRPIVLGGGGVTAPSLEFGLVLETSATNLEYDIVNLDVTNPAVVELAFSLNALEVVEFDDGTAASPSFALDPGSTRQILFTRGSGAPAIGEDSVTEIITATLADGSIVVQTVDVDPPPGAFKDVIANIASPTLEFLFDDVGANPAWPKNTGTWNGAGTPNFGDGQLVGTHTIATEALDGFDGYIQMESATTRFANLEYLPLTTILRNADRSWVYVWDSLDSLGFDADLEASAAGGSFWNYAICIPGGGGSTDRTGGGHILTSVVSTPNVIRIEHSGLVAAAGVELTSGNGTHSAVGSAQNCILDGGIRTVLVVTYDHAAAEVTVRWKQTGNPSGHTYITHDTDFESGDPAITTYWEYLGSSGHFGYYPPVENARYRYFGVVDHTITSGEFDDLTVSAGV